MATVTMSRTESPGLLISAARGLVSGIFLLGGLSLFLTGLGIAAVDAMHDIDGVAFTPEWKVRRALRWAGAIGATWGGMSGIVAGVVGRPRRIWSRGIFPRTTRAAVGWILGGTLGATAFYLMLSPDPSRRHGAMFGAVLGGLAGAILTARSFRPTVYQPAPPRRASEISFVAKSVVAIFAAIIVLKFLILDLIPYAILLVLCVAGVLIMYRAARRRR